MKALASGEEEMKDLYKPNRYEPQDYLVPDGHAIWMLVGAAIWAVLGIVIYFMFF